MKLKPYVHIRPGRISIGTTPVDDELRADMCLPAWLFTMGLFLVMFGGILGTVSIVLPIPKLVFVFAAVLVLVGVAAIICWKNQTIHMLPNDTFVYSTLFGNKTVYRFDEIKRIKYSSDSITLLVGDGKVHIESIALVSKRLEERIHKQLQELNGNVRNH